MVEKVMQNRRKTHQNGAQMGAKIDEKSIKKQGRKIDAKKDANWHSQPGGRSPGGTTISTRLR